MRTVLMLTILLEIYLRNGSDWVLSKTLEIPPIDGIEVRAFGNIRVRWSWVRIAGLTSMASVLEPYFYMKTGAPFFAKC